MLLSSNIQFSLLKHYPQRNQFIGFENLHFSYLANVLTNGFCENKTTHKHAWKLNYAPPLNQEIRDFLKSLPSSNFIAYTKRAIQIEGRSKNEALTYFNGVPCCAYHTEPLDYEGVCPICEANAEQALFEYFYNL